jgi:hypothetical protein
VRKRLDQLEADEVDTLELPAANDDATDTAELPVVWPPDVGER